MQNEVKKSSRHPLCISVKPPKTLKKQSPWRSESRRWENFLSPYWEGNFLSPFWLKWLKNRVHDPLNMRKNWVPIGIDIGKTKSPNSRKTAITHLSKGGERRRESSTHPQPPHHKSNYPTLKKKKWPCQKKEEERRGTRLIPPPFFHQGNPFPGKGRRERREARLIPPLPSPYQPRPPEPESASLSS